MYTYKPITDISSSQSTLDSWLKEASQLGDEGLFVARDVQDIFNRLKAHSTDSSNCCHAYLLYDEETDDSAVAVLDFSHAMGHTENSWLKLLNIHLRPSLQPSSDIIPLTEKSEKLLLTFGKAIGTAIQLIFKDHPSKELKIYARTTEMKFFFRGAIEHTPTIENLKKDGLLANIEGNWLVIRKIE